MTNTKIKSYLLVTLQFIGIGLIGFYENGIPTSAIFSIVEFAGLFLAIWAFAIMKYENFRFTSEPKSHAQLITKGPYFIIRHPMYSSILIVAVPMLVDYYSISRLFMLLALCVILILKVEHEEKILENHFKEYSDYQKKTYKILPFVY